MRSDGGSRAAAGGAAAKYGDALAPKGTAVKAKRACSDDGDAVVCDQLRAISTNSRGQSVVRATCLRLSTATSLPSSARSSLAAARWMRRCVDAAWMRAVRSDSGRGGTGRGEVDEATASEREHRRSSSSDGRLGVGDGDCRGERGDRE